MPTSANDGRGGLSGTRRAPRNDPDRRLPDSEVVLSTDLEPYVAIADELRTRVRERGPRDVRVWLVAAMRAVAEQRIADWPALAMELAKAIPDTVPLDELTAWTRGGAGRVGAFPHGTSVGAWRHRRRKQKPCDACMAAERAYLRDRRAKWQRDGMVVRRSVDPDAVAAALGDERGNLTLPQKREAAVRLAELGLSARQIGRQIGSDQRTVRAWLPDAAISASPAVDEVAIQRAMGGEAVNLSTVEKREAIRRLTEKGESARDVARRLRISSRSVQRYRVALRESESEAA